MSNEEKREDLLKRVEEAKAYIRENYQFEWYPRLEANQSKIEAVDAFHDLKVYETVEEPKEDVTENN